MLHLRYSVSLLSPAGCLFFISHCLKAKTATMRRKSVSEAAAATAPPTRGCSQAPPARAPGSGCPQGGRGLCWTATSPQNNAAPSEATPWGRLPPPPFPSPVSLRLPGEVPASPACGPGTDTGTWDRTRSGDARLRHGPSDDKQPAQPHRLLTPGQGVPGEKPWSCHVM